MWTTTNNSPEKNVRVCKYISSGLISIKEEATHFLTCDKKRNDSAVINNAKKKRPAELAPCGTIGESLYILFGCSYNIQKLPRLINKFYHFLLKKTKITNIYWYKYTISRVSK